MTKVTQLSVFFAFFSFLFALIEFAICVKRDCTHTCSGKLLTPVPILNARLFSPQVGLIMKWESFSPGRTTRVRMRSTSLIPSVLEGESIYDKKLLE